MRLLLAGVLLVTGAVSADAAGRSQLDHALASGDTLAMTAAVESIYRDAGISLDDRLVWTLKPYTETFNYFSDMYSEIVLGSIPAESEVADYWSNWSRTLTGGHWQADAFFNDDAEARDLARYNQFVLAAHEMAHAVTYRYDPDHMSRHANAVNCREFYADRLTAALLQDSAEADPDLAVLRGRYVALMASMNGAIAEADRYHIDSLARLMDDCASIPVSQPTPETLQPYASAFFERQRLLLDADLPPLRQLAEELLFPRLAEANADYRHSTVALSLTLVTGADIADPGTDHLSTDDYWTAGGFTGTGETALARFEHVSRALPYSMYYGKVGELEPVVVDTPWLRPDAFVEMTSLLPVDQNGFFVTLIEDRETALLMLGSRDAGAWTFVTIAERSGARQAKLVRDEEGRVYFMTAAELDHFGSTKGWKAEQVMTDGLVEVAEYELIYGEPIGLHQGFLLTQAEGRVLSFDADANYDVLAGNGLIGSKDGAPDQQEFIRPEVAQALADGRVMILDRTPDYADFRVRELRPVKWP